MKLGKMKKGKLVASATPQGLVFFNRKNNANSDFLQVTTRVGALDLKRENPNSDFLEVTTRVGAGNLKRKEATNRPPFVQKSNTGRTVND